MYNIHPMRFLAKALSGGARFLGHATSGARYLGKALPTVGKALGAAQAFSSNRAVQDLAGKVGIGPNVFSRVNSAIDTTQNAIGLLPGVARDVNSALSSAGQSLQPARRSIADLYRQANA